MLESNVSNIMHLVFVHPISCHEVMVKAYSALIVILACGVPIMAMVSPSHKVKSLSPDLDMKYLNLSWTVSLSVSVSVTLNS